jgi:hypothetical protein
MIRLIGTSIAIRQLTINDCLRLAPFLTGLRETSLPLRLTWFCHFFSFRCPLVNTPQLNTQLSSDSSLTAESESYVTTDGQSASLSWNKAPIWCLRPDLYYCRTVAGLFMWGVLSDERAVLSFTAAAGPRQRSHSRVRVPWDL